MRIQPATQSRLPIEQMAPLRVVIAESRLLARVGMAMLVRSDEEFELVGHASDSVDLDLLLARSSCDLLLFDPEMPVLDAASGMLMIARLRAIHPCMQVIVVTAETSTAQMEFGFTCGADGYIGRTEAAEVLINTMHQVCSGVHYQYPL